MNNQRIFLCALLFSSTLAISHFHKNDANSSSSCSDDSDCNYPNGDCLSHKCVCRLYYDGATCTQDWRDDKTWLTTFVIYSVWEIVLQTICFVLGSWQLYVTLKYSHNGNWARWSVTTFILIITIAAAFSK